MASSLKYNGTNDQSSGRRLVLAVYIVRVGLSNIKYDCTHIHHTAAELSVVARPTSTFSSHFPSPTLSLSLPHSCSPPAPSLHTQQSLVRLFRSLLSARHV